MSLPLRIGWALLGAFYLVAGVNHFRDRDFYVPMMPPAIPAPLEMVELSGAFEVGIGVAALALGFAAPPLRRAIAWAAIALLVAVFPANLHVAYENVPIGGRAEGFGALNYVRLPFQALFVAWAWIYTRRLAGDGDR